MQFGHNSHFYDDKYRKKDENRIVSDVKSKIAKEAPNS